MPSSLVGSLVVLLASYAQANCIYGTSLHKRAPGEPVEVATFGYHGVNGPINWAGLSPNNTLCNHGKNQSPINLDESIKFATESPVIDIPNPVDAAFENLGSTVEVVMNGTTTVGGTKYKLKQFHLHTPSEHHVDEEHYPLEMHMVHESEAGGQFVVLGVLFQMAEAAGEGAAVIKTLAAQVDEIREPGSVTTIETLDLAPVVEALQTQPLFSYSGSLTTPPCSEGINWLVMNHALLVDPASYNAIKDVVNFNSRYTQNAPGEPNLLELAAAEYNAKDPKDPKNPEEPKKPKRSN